MTAPQEAGPRPAPLQAAETRGSRTMVATSQQLRNAAILLRSLDAESAAALLGELSPAESKRLRDAVRQLGEVTDDERNGVADAVRGEAPFTDAAPAGVELALSNPDAAPPAPQPAPRGEAVAAAPKDETPDPKDERLFADAEPAWIAAYLERQQPSVAAVALSCLPAAKAAEVLDELRFDLRAAAIERLASLSEGDAGTLSLVADDLTQWVTTQRRASRLRADRLAKVDAILRAATPAGREQLHAHLAGRGCDWLDEVSWDSGQAGGEPSAESPSPAPPTDARPAATSENTPAADSDRHASSIDQSRETVAPQPPRIPFGLLERLPVRLLAEVVRRTPSRQVLLALAGGSGALQRRIESQVPDKQARQLRRQIEALGPTRLRDVEAAQQAMALTAAAVLEAAKPYPTKAMAR